MSFPGQTASKLPALAMRKGMRYPDDSWQYSAFTEPERANLVVAHAHSISSGNPHATTAVQVGAEPELGAPAVSGYVLASTTGRVRSWMPPVTVVGAVWAKGTEAQRPALVPSPQEGQSFYFQTDRGVLPPGPLFYAEGKWIPFGSMRDAAGNWWYQDVVRLDDQGRAEFGPVCVS